MSCMILTEDQISLLFLGTFPRSLLHLESCLHSRGHSAASNWIRAQTYQNGKKSIRNLRTMTTKLMLRFQLLASLKAEKLIKDRMITQKNEQGRNMTILFYFINYRAILNVVKYKIDHMR